LRDGFTRKHIRDVGQDEKGEELTQQKRERDERASGLSRRRRERKRKSRRGKGHFVLKENFFSSTTNRII